MASIQPRPLTRNRIAAIVSLVATLSDGDGTPPYENLTTASSASAYLCGLDVTMIPSPHTAVQVRHVCVCFDFLEKALAESDEQR